MTLPWGAYSPSKPLLVTNSMARSLPLTASPTCSYFISFCFVFIFNYNRILVCLCVSLTVFGLSQEGKSGPRRNIRLLKANYIKDFSYLGQAEDPLDVKNCYLDINALQAREELAVR